MRRTRRHPLARRYRKWAPYRSSGSPGANSGTEGVWVQRMILCAKTKNCAVDEVDGLLDHCVANCRTHAPAPVRGRSGCSARSARCAQNNFVSKSKLLLLHKRIVVASSCMCCDKNFFFRVKKYSRKIFG